MSKIPQGEWSAIAARYAQGESISRIAQSYGCTPPAIHYILKRNKQRTAQGFDQPLDARSKPQPPPNPPDLVHQRGAPEVSRTVGSSGQQNGISPRIARDTGPTQGQVRPDWQRQVAPAREALSHGAQTPIAQQQARNAASKGQGSALSAGLDDELQGRAEAAMAAFRSSFDAARAEGTPLVRQQLREAASDLMRVAARTTIVLDRLNASTERTPVAPYQHFRSG